MAHEFPCWELRGQHKDEPVPGAAEARVVKDNVPGNDGRRRPVLKHCRLHVDRLYVKYTATPPAQLDTGPCFLDPTQTDPHSYNPAGRGVATGWTGVDISTPLLPEVVAEIDANLVVFSREEEWGLGLKFMEFAKYRE